MFVCLFISAIPGWTTILTFFSTDSSDEQILTDVNSSIKKILQMKSELTYGKNRLNFKHKVQQENAQTYQKINAGWDEKRISTRQYSLKIVNRYFMRDN